MAAPSWGFVRACDFPAAPPPDLKMPPEEFVEFKRGMLGAEIPAPWLAPAEIAAAGCADWREYWLTQCMSNWG